MPNKPGTQRTPNPTPSRELPNALPGIDVDDALERLRNNTELLRTLLLMFCRENAEAATRIKQAIADHDLDLAARLVHTLKGMSANISAKDLTESTLQLEKALRTDDFSALCKLQAAVAANLAVVLDCRTILEQQHPDEPTPPRPHTSGNVDWSRVDGLLQRLQALLEQNNLNAQIALRDLKTAIVYDVHPDVQSRMCQLETSMGRLDYDTAVHVAESLANMLSQQFSEQNNTDRR